METLLGRPAWPDMITIFSFHRLSTAFDTDTNNANDDDDDDDDVTINKTQLRERP